MSVREAVKGQGRNCIKMPFQEKLSLSLRYSLKRELHPRRGFLLKEWGPGFYNQHQSLPDCRPEVWGIPVM